MPGDTFIDDARPPPLLYTAVAASIYAARHVKRHGARTPAWAGTGDRQVGPLDQATRAQPVCAAADQQVAAVIHISGTFGAPNRLMLSHANLLCSARSASRSRGFAVADRCYCGLLLAHGVGFATEFLGSMAGDASVRLAPRFTSEKAARVLAHEDITWLLGVPTIAALLLGWSRSNAQPLQAPRCALHRRQLAADATAEDPR